MAGTLIYGAIGSPYVARVVLAARLKGLEFDLRLPPEGLRSPGFLALNPLGKIPVLVDAAVTLPESEVICQYLDERYPDPPLLPAEPADRARARLLSRLVDQYLLPPLLAASARNRQPPADPAAVAAGLDRARSGLASLGHFAGPGPALWGASPGLADCALAPALVFAAEALGSAGGADLPAAHPRIAAWWDWFRATPVGRAYVSEAREAFAAFRRRRAAATSNTKSEE
jgi:glutathione S-transferase